MTKKNGSKKRDAKNKERFLTNLVDVFSLSTFAEKEDGNAGIELADVTKNPTKNETVDGGSGDPAVVEEEIESDDLTKNETVDSDIKGGDSAKMDDIKHVPYGSLDIRFRYDVEPTSEILWYQHFVGNKKN